MTGFLTLDTQDSTLTGLTIVLRNRAGQTFTLVSTNKDASFAVHLPPGEYEIVTLAVVPTKAGKAPTRTRHMSGTFLEIQAGAINTLGVAVWSLSKDSPSHFSLKQPQPFQLSVAEAGIASGWRESPRVDVRLYRYLGLDKVYFVKP